MRLIKYFLKLKEEGEVGSGATTTGNIAQYQQKLSITRRITRGRTKVKKSKLLG